jgi:DNA-binding NarL/FixJ family response regulator
MIKIAIAEDIQKIAETLKEKVELSPDFEVKFIANNGKSMLQKITQNNAVDVIIMDINMPVMDGIACTQRITQQFPNIKIIMSTVFDDEQNLFQAIMAGASGYLLKDEPPAMVHRSIYEALEGGAPMSPIIARKSLALLRNGVKQPVQKGEDYDLTNRELEILQLIAKGLTYDQIANNLFISYGTVRKHVENIYKKMKSHNKIEAIEKGKNSGII